MLCCFQWIESLQEGASRVTVLRYVSKQSLQYSRVCVANHHRQGWGGIFSAKCFAWANFLLIFALVKNFAIPCSLDCAEISLGAQAACAQTQTEPRSAI